MTHRSLAALLFALVLTPACAAADADEGQGESENAVVAPANVSTAEVESVIAKLRAQRESAPFARYYEDGSRIEGCWRNPAGAKLTELKKAVYCAMPLELRLCNTPVLLTVDEHDVVGRFRGYVDCKKKVDAVFGGRASFAYGPDVDAVYRQIYLEGRTLSAEDTTRIVAANVPRYSSRSFLVVLASIGASLVAEARELAVDALLSMARDYEHDTGLEPR